MCWCRACFDCSLVARLLGRTRQSIVAAPADLAERERLARRPHDHLANDIEAGCMVPLLEHFNPREAEPFHAVYRVSLGGS